MNIILTGLRGSGKSKIGKILSGKLEWEFLDLDKEIEKAEGMTIPEIYKEHGWEYFREKEKATVARLGNIENTVISLGGGTIVDPENQKILKELGTIVYLERLQRIATNIYKNQKKIILHYRSCLCIPAEIYRLR